MLKVLIAIGSVAAFILLGTYLLSGTGLLGGIGGMFVRVLVGFAVLFVSIQIAISSDHNKSNTAQH
jgi:hypothetical protein